VLAATADPNAVQQRIIAACAERQPVHSLVQAPEDFADHFDELGGLLADRWAEAEVPLQEDQIVITDRPADQAAAAVRAVDDLDGAYPAEQITLGLCDDRVAPHLQQQLPAFGLPVRHAEGIPASRTRPLRLLAAAADWVGRHRFADFATLVRHPDVERWLINRAGSGGSDGDGHGNSEAEEASETRETIEDWLTLLDRYYNDHFQLRLTGPWLGPPDRRARLNRLREGVGELLGALEGGKARPLSDWAEPIAEVLVRLYGAGELDRRDPAQRVVVETCEQLRTVLGELHELDAEGVPEVTAAEALHLVVRAAGTRPIPSEPAEAAIEMLGPLELRMDDAEALILTGFNEGHMPSSVQADPFLPDALRSHLGLADNRRRYARDLYAMRAVLGGRPSVKVIAGRRTAEGDPMLPSRLLFACDRSSLPGRVRRFTEALGRANAEVNDREGVAEGPGIAAAASENDVPIYCPAVQDSVLGLQAWMFNQLSEFTLDALADMEPLTDLAFDAEEAGAMVVGGGVPKNFVLQTMLVAPGAYDYAVQLTMDSPNTGGLSGATLDEARSWGKIEKAGRNASVYADATITLPLVVAAARERISEA